ncbi:hypothetical protein [Tritonibacter litoralis]|nr:hypothetical protein [Tritonibacter litoralis]
MAYFPRFTADEFRARTDLVGPECRRANGFTDYAMIQEVETEVLAV